MNKTYWQKRKVPRVAFRINENENTELTDYFKCDVIHEKGKRGGFNRSGRDGYIPHGAGNIYFDYGNWLVERWEIYDGERNDLIPEVMTNEDFLDDFEVARSDSLRDFLANELEGVETRDDLSHDFITKLRNYL